MYLGLAVRRAGEVVLGVATPHTHPRRRRRRRNQRLPQSNGLACAWADPAVTRTYENARV